MIIGVCALLLAVLVGLFSIRSQANFTRAEAQRLAAEANNLYKSSGSPELIALLALHSMNLQYSPQGDEVLTRAANLNYPMQIYTGHTKVVWGASFSVDGKYVLTGSEDGTARLWDRKTGQEVRQFGCPYLVYQVAFAPDGRSILTNCGDTSIRLWDLETGKPLPSFPPAEQSVKHVGFIANGKILACNETVGGLRLYDVASGARYRHQFKEKKIEHFAISPDGRTMAIASGWVANPGLDLMDLSTGQTKRLAAVTKLRSYWKYR